MKKIAIFGGSFDPPHKGHLKIIRHLEKKFDRVIIMPAFISPFKAAAGHAPANDRLEMLHILKQEKGLNAEVSTFELDKKGISYTTDTLRHYAGKEGADSEIYFVIGSESAKTLHLWRDSDWLKKNAVFYVVPREGYTLKQDFDANSENNTAAQKNNGFNLKTAPISVKDYSSALFKAARAFKREKSIVTPAVYKYIAEKDLYNQFKPLTAGFKVFKMRPERILHTFGAVKAGIRLAKIHGEDVDKTITALTLHDIGKYADGDMLKKAGVVPACTKGIPPDCCHAIIGECIARQYFKITDSDVLNAILYHTTGRHDMSRLEKITAIADYTEEGRNFKDAKEIAEIAKIDLDRALVGMLSNVIEYLNRVGKEIFGISYKALSFYRDLVYNSTIKHDSDKTDSKNPVKQGEKMDVKKASLMQSYEDSRALAKEIAGYLDDKKADKIVIIDISKRTTIADYFVICSARSATAVRALTDHVDDLLSKNGIEPKGRDIDAKWAAIDYGSVILHIFHEETRSFYALERLWEDGDNAQSFPS